MKKISEIFDEKRFPFLIGRIRTEEVEEVESLENIEFPFLIGRIRTNYDTIILVFLCLSFHSS